MNSTLSYTKKYTSVQLLSEEALLIWPAQPGELCQAANEEASIRRSMMTAPFTGHYFHRLPLAPLWHYIRSHPSWNDV